MPQGDGWGTAEPTQDPPPPPLPHCTGVNTQVSAGRGPGVGEGGTSTLDLLWMGHDALCPLKCSLSPQTAAPPHPSGPWASLPLSPAPHLQGSCSRRSGLGAGSWVPGHPVCPLQGLNLGPWAV